MIRQIFLYIQDGIQTQFNRKSPTSNTGKLILNFGYIISNSMQSTQCF